MRKYQQLTLLVLTVLSVSILVMYKRENAKLKYVLDVVNFFGRNDADAILKLENDTVQSANVYDLGYPMASWQWLGKNFHAYSAFWKQNTGGGGEITALVVGLPNVAINFKCFVRFADKGKMKGRFSFTRVHETISTQFKFYKFYCKYEGNLRKVVALTLTDVETKQEHTLLTRDLQNKQIRDKISLTVCLDLSNAYNESLDNFATVINIQQFFYHYHILGATEFIVYGTKGMTTFLKNHLLRHGIQPNIFPYNFPFDETMQKPNRAIITIDCLLRTSNIAQYTLVAGINEYLYPFAARFKPNTDFYQFMEQYAEEMTQFEVTTRQICMSPHNKLILSDNNLSELLPNGEKFNLYRPQYNYENFKTITLDAKRISVNRYVQCTDTANVFDWRHKIDDNSLRYIDTISKELNLYLMQ